MWVLGDNLWFQYLTNYGIDEPLLPLPVGWVMTNSFSAFNKNKSKLSLQNWSKALKKKREREKLLLSIGHSCHRITLKWPGSWTWVTEGIQAAGEDLASSISTDGEVMTALGLLWLTHLNVVRTKGAFDPRETGSTSYCVRGNTLISCFDSKHWHYELYICLIIVTGPLFGSASLSHWVLVDTPLHTWILNRWGEVFGFFLNLLESISAPKATRSSCGLYQWRMWSGSRQQI